MRALIAMLWLPIARSSPRIVHDARSHPRTTPVPGLARKSHANQSDCCPLPNARPPKELIQIFVSPDALGVASGREARLRYNRMDVIAGLAYYDREVEWRLACANQRHRSRTIRVHRISAGAGTPDHRNVAVDRHCGHLRQLAIAVERRVGNAINE